MNQENKLFTVQPCYNCESQSVSHRFTDSSPDEFGHGELIEWYLECAGCGNSVGPKKDSIQCLFEWNERYKKKYGELLLG